MTPEAKAHRDELYSTNAFTDEADYYSSVSEFHEMLSISWTNGYEFARKEMEAESKLLGTELINLYDTLLTKYRNKPQPEGE